MRQMKPADRKDKIAVVVGTVTNDVRVLEIPKLTVSHAERFVERLDTVENITYWGIHTLTSPPCPVAMWVQVLLPFGGMGVVC